ncbi:unnamed protein product [Alopecurus aequalis]
MSTSSSSEMEAARASRKRRALAAEGSRPARRPPPAGVDEDDGGGVDHISALPDALLGEIITLLPTKDGARTQILSPRWRHLWSSAPLNLDLSDIYRYGVAGDDKLVSRVLSAHAGPGRRFSTRNLGGRYAAAVDGWLRSPALDNLQEIEFELYHSLQQVVVPALVFRFSSTLRVAHIGRCNIPEFIVQGLHFPELQQLGLNYVTISEASLHSIMRGCPVLQSLLVTDCLGFRCIRIDSLTLRGFGCHQPHDSGNGGVPIEEIIIHNAPCLERVLLYSSTGTRVLVVAAPKLETVGIECHSATCKVIFSSTVIQDLPGDKLAMAVRTVKILCVDMRPFSLDTAIEFITCFPCLEKLYIKAGDWTESNNLWRRKHKDLVKCIDLSLKTIVLESCRGFRGVKWQVNFATFFVLNARLLESFTLRVSSYDYNEEELRRKLQLEKRASRAARFHFTTERVLRRPLDLKDVRDLETDPFVRQC